GGSNGKVPHHQADPSELRSVFRAFTDPALVVDWMDGIGLIDATGELDRPGTYYTLVVWRPWRFRTQVVRVEAPRIHEIAGRGPLGSSYRMVATLTEIDGLTKLDLLTEYTMPLGPIGRLIDRRWVDREPHAIANREVDRLVALVSDPRLGPQPKGASRAAAVSG
ncbi:MAG: hypothetical protein ABIP53_10145, partial [Candidatus Limnocylindrales bacterium]